MSLSFAPVGLEPLSSPKLLVADELEPSAIVYIPGLSIVKDVEQTWPDEATPLVKNLGPLT